MKINDYLKVTAAAKVLGVCSATLRNWEKKGMIKSYRGLLGGNNSYRLYKREDCIKLLEKLGDDDD